MIKITESMITLYCNVSEATEKYALWPNYFFSFMMIFKIFLGVFFPYYYDYLQVHDNRVFEKYLVYRKIQLEDLTVLWST